MFPSINPTITTCSRTTSERWRPCGQGDGEAWLGESFDMAGLFGLDEHEETLAVPIYGKVEPSRGKVAFRRFARKAHPDAGGSHEQFVRITQARNALLD